MTKYQSIPREVKFRAIYYRAAVRSGLAAPHLLLHHQYHLQITFLTEEEMEDSSKVPVEGTVSDGRRLNLPKDHQERELTSRKGNEELYPGSIGAITDMLTFAKHIDDRALLTTFYLNQSYFHAACAYIRDMLQRKGELHLPEEAKGKTVPIPSRSAPSLVDPFQDYSQCPKIMMPATGSSAAMASTSSYLTHRQGQLPIPPRSDLRGGSLLLGSRMGGCGAGSKRSRASGCRLENCE